MSKPSAVPALTKFQRFTTERVPRSAIKNCPYNPRVLAPAARKKLTASVKKGLLGPVYVNKTTMNCYAGNQRLAALDALEGSGKYMLDVAMTTLSVKDEKAACVRLNNESLMGSWDLAALADLLPDLDLADTGFEEMQLETLLGEKGEGIFGKAEQTPEVRGAVEDVEDMLGERAKEAEAAKGRRQKIRETTKATNEGADTERIGYVVFPSRKAREDWVESLGLQRNERYVPAKVLKRV
jgi:hypothetical protein